MNYVFFSLSQDQGSTTSTMTFTNVKDSRFPAITECEFESLSEDVVCSLKGGVHLDEDPVLDVICVYS